MPALYNGVSQQPAILRSPDQTEAEVNTWASLATGVEKRPPSETVSVLAYGIQADAFIHHINRDTAERYVVVVEPGAIRVFDHLTGDQKVVNAPAGLGYLAGGRYAATTVADFTFIVNRDRVCALGPAGADIVAQPDYYRALGRGDGGGSLAQYETNPNPGAFKGDVASMDKLPDVSADGDTYRVTGSAETGFISYYVRRSGAVWDETVKVGMQNALDPLTMPHCLIREADGTFTFVPFSWAVRRVGDEKTNPAPTFVGRTISDVFFYQNRLAFLVDENVVFSCAGDFGNFWRSTVLDLLDSDVVDVAATASKVSLLNHAVPFNDGVMLFADQTQFSLSNGENGVTPSSVAILPVTHFEVNAKARPVPIGTELYFCGEQGGSTVVWEYSRTSDTDATDAAEVTAHVPTLLPAGIKRLVAAPKTLFALTGGDTVWVYQFYWSGTEKVQSAWRPWRFNGNVRSAEYLGGYLYVVIERPGDNVWLERINLKAGARPAAQPAQVYLDRQKGCVGTYNPVTNRTTFMFTIAPDKGRFRIVRGSGHPTAAHSLVDPAGYVWLNNIKVEVPGNEAHGAYTVGEAYPMRLQFSRQFPQNYRGQPVTTGRLQLRTWTINFVNTAYFETEVSPYGIAPDIEAVVPAKLADFTGKVVGADALKLNRPTYAAGSYSFQIYGDAAQATVALVNDTHVGSTFVSAEWEGFYFNRATG